MEEENAYHMSAELHWFLVALASSITGKETSVNLSFLKTTDANFNALVSSDEKFDKQS